MRRNDVAMGLQVQEPYPRAQLPTQSEPGTGASAYCWHFDENNDWPEDLTDKVIDEFERAKEEP